MSYQMIKKKKKESKDDLKDLFRDEYYYSAWSKNEEESTDKEESEDLPLIPTLESDGKEVKEGKALQILTPNRL